MSKSFQSLAVLWLAAWCHLGGLIPAGAAEPAVSEDTPAPSVRSFEQQQQEIFRLLESVQHDSAEQAKKNSDLLVERLQQIEQSVALEKQREIEAQKNLNHLFLVALAVIGGLGVLGLGIMGLLVLKMMKRLTDIAERNVELTQHSAGGHLHFLETGAPGSPQHLTESMAQLDARLREMEQAYTSPAPGIVPKSSQS